MDETPEGIKKIDALAIYSKDRETLLRTMTQRERIVVGILAGNGRPMNAEEIRVDYLNMVHSNIMLNLKMIEFALDAGTAPEDALGWKAGPEGDS